MFTCKDFQFIVQTFLGLEIVKYRQMSFICFFPHDFACLPTIVSALFLNYNANWVQSALNFF